jgi:hypothetical protein
MGRKVIQQPEREDLIEFVERVRMRNGYVDVKELLVELIGLHQKYIAVYKNENKPPHHQLEMMWIDLQHLYERQIKSEIQHGEKRYYERWLKDQQKIKQKENV